MYAPVRAANGLPNLGGGADLSLGDERRLGQQVMPNLHGSGLVVEDPLLNQYLYDLWQPVF
ncbi:MAG: peptidase M48, partial [Burkholderiaceae bacterium]|nr:peptidase M48 [Burkholderiaceae bacterium]